MEVLPNADVVLWTGPVYATKKIFESIKPHIDLKKTCVGTIFGQGLVHVSAIRVFGPSVKFFALRNIPWLCRMTEKGGITYLPDSTAMAPLAGLGFAIGLLANPWAL